MIDTPPASPAESASKPAAASTPDFFVVGIGASAGGLAAVTELLRTLPPRCPLAVVVVQHLDPEHESMLVELLSRATSLPVEWAAQGRSLQPGQVYVAPRKSRVAVHHRMFICQEPAPGATHNAIDHFFKSLADDAGDSAIAVVLSGNGSDGAKGLQAVKRAGGVTFAQTTETATHPSMPQAAVATGAVDRVLPPAGIAEELVRIVGNDRAFAPARPLPVEEAPEDRNADILQSIFRLLAVRTGVDFSEYKRTTIHRRLVRRMVLTKASNLPAYLEVLETNRDEVTQLYESFLINVTEFFRDPDAFDFLKEHVLPRLAERHSDNTPIRLWVPGCSTGEEAYSLAIILRELLEDTGRIAPVQIFATDVSDRAIAIARAGMYSAAELANVNADRLRRFFFQTERGYVVQKPIRDMCVFARQNVAKDSPFSRLDLVSCRNLLIYLSQRLQRKLMPIFHYALAPGGYLVLGSSESVGAHADYFSLLDRRFRIYVQKPALHRATFEFSVDQPRVGPPPPLRTLPPLPEHMKEPFDIIREADRIVLSRLGPTGVLINDELEILQFRGDVTPFLAPLEGRASLNLVKMAREGLAAELQEAVTQARERNVRIQKSGVAIMQGDTPRSINLDVTPVPGTQTAERFYLVLFTPADKSAGRSEQPAAKDEVPPPYLAQIDQLRQDLQATRNYLQSTIEKHEATNQELRAANEEIQSSNEELQSTNEELETAKEELQSTNEELTTVNEELHSRQLELIQLNNDLTNLINSVHLPIIILGQDMRIRRFTPMAERVLNVIPTDVGRPLTDININLNVPNLHALMGEVVDSLTIREFEVQDRSGRWYSMRLRPYKTAENKIEGVVITLIDVDQIKRASSELERARDLAATMLRATGEWTVVLDAQGRIRLASDAFCRALNASLSTIEDRSLFDLIGGGGDMASLRAELANVATTGGEVNGKTLTLDLGGTPARMVANVRRVSSTDGRDELLLLVARSLP